MLIRVGRVLKAHGVRGQLKCAYSTDRPAALNERRAYLLHDPSSGECEVVTRRAIELLPEYFFALFAEYSAPEPLVRLAGWDICCCARRGELPRDDPDEVYFFELRGLRVLSPDGTEVGEVTDIIETGAHVVLEVAGRYRLLPYTKQFVSAVDLAAGTLTTSYPLDGGELK